MSSFIKQLQNFTKRACIEDKYLVTKAVLKKKWKSLFVFSLRNSPLVEN